MRPATVGDPRRESSVHRVAKVSIERGYHARRPDSGGPPASRPCVTLDAARYHDGWRVYREPQKHWF
jgi:hypothetical protein